MTPRLRPATADDVAAINAIYREEVLHGTATWEYDPPDDVEMGRRLRAILEQGYPYLVAEVDGAVGGYAYASSYRARPGYRFVVEDSIYIHPDLRGRGLGKLLLPALIEACVAGGWKSMIAVIGDSANTGSIRLHAACGFVQAGLFPAIGWKHDRWLDSVQMLRRL